MKASQSGLVLMVSLIMLTLVTMIVVASANVVMGNLNVVQNIEVRAAAKSAALSAMQEAILTPGFMEGNKAFVTGCQGSAFTKCFDMTGDDLPDDMSVTLTQPICIAAHPIRNSALNVWEDPDDASCYQPGVYSLCANAQWEVTITAEDAVTGARVVIRQGLTTRAPVNLIQTACG